MSTEQGPPAPPIYSPDGQWWWDGEQWQPVQVPEPVPQAPVQPWHRRHRGLLILGGILGVVFVVGLFAAIGRQSQLARCQVAPAALVTYIGSGSDFEGFALSHVRVVKSNDFHNVYFVSGQITIPGQPSSVGTWASTRLDGSQPVWAVDLSARTSTHWGPGPDSAEMSVNDDGAQLSRECAAG
jgi:hypothetical protein